MIQETPLLTLRARLSWSFFLSLLFIALYGYTVFGGDQEEHLPWVFRLIHPELYPRDYFVPAQMSAFNVRFFFVQLIYGLSWLMPIGMAIFLCYLSCLMSSLYLVGSLAMKWSNNAFSFFLAPLFSFVVLNRFTVGGNAVFDTQLTCSCFAIAFGLAAIYQSIRKQYVWAAALAALAALFQLLFGLHAMLFVCLFLLIQEGRGGVSSLLKSFGVFLFLSSPMFYPVLQRQLAAEEAGGITYNEIFFFFRNPHHYDVLAFPLKDMLLGLMLWSAAAYQCYRRPNAAYRRYFGYALLLVCALLVVDGVGFQWLGIAFIGKLQFYKTTVWLTVLAGIVLAVSWSDQLTWLRTKLMTNHARIHYVSLLLLICLSTTLYWPETLPGRYRYQLFRYPQRDLNRLHEWIRCNLPVDALILPLPNDDSFLCEAQRSIPVGYKAIIHEPFFMLPWYKRFVDVYGVSYDPASHHQRVMEKAVDLYPLRNDADIVTDQTINYRIWDLRETKDNMLTGKEIVHREGAFVIATFRP